MGRSPGRDPLPGRTVLHRDGRVIGIGYVIATGADLAAQLDEDVPVAFSGVASSIDRLDVISTAMSGRCGYPGTPLARPNPRSLSVSVAGMAAPRPSSAASGRRSTGWRQVPRPSTRQSGSSVVSKPATSATDSMVPSPDPRMSQPNRGQLGWQVLTAGWVAASVDDQVEVVIVDERDFGDADDVGGPARRRQVSDDPLDRPVADTSDRAGRPEAEAGARLGTEIAGLSGFRHEQAAVRCDGQPPRCMEPFGYHLDRRSLADHRRAKRRGRQECGAERCQGRACGHGEVLRSDRRPCSAQEPCRPSFTGRTQRRGAGMRDLLSRSRAYDQLLRP